MEHDKYVPKTGFAIKLVVLVHLLNLEVVPPTAE